MKKNLIIVFGIGFTLMAMSVLSNSNAFFWNDQPVVTLADQIAEKKEASNLLSKALKQSLADEWALERQAAAEGAKDHYSVALTEDEELRQVWQDRGADIERAKDMTGRAFIELIQWAMYEKSKPEVGAMDVAPAKTDELQSGVFNL